MASEIPKSLCSEAKGAEIAAATSAVPPPVLKRRQSTPEEAKRLRKIRERMQRRLQADAVMLEEEYPPLKGEDLARSIDI